MSYMYDTSMGEDLEGLAWWMVNVLRDTRRHVFPNDVEAAHDLYSAAVSRMQELGFKEPK